MDIKIRYGEDKKKIIASVKGQDSVLADVIIALMFAKDEQVIETFGDTIPTVVIDDVADEKIVKEAKDFQEFLNKTYEHYWKKQSKK